MNNYISERRIKSNKLRRRRQIRRNISICFVTLFIIAGLSITLFSFKSKAESDNTEIFYKYYKSIVVETDDTLWDYASQYANKDYYESYNDYIKEVKSINHMKGDKIVHGQFIIVPYYSNEFVG